MVVLTTSVVLADRQAENKERRGSCQGRNVLFLCGCETIASLVRSDANRGSVERQAMNEVQPTARCFFVSDLHGKESRFRKLFSAIEGERPVGVFLGGDLLPGGGALGFSCHSSQQDFMRDFIAVELLRLRQTLGTFYPRVFAILGNDDGRFEEEAMLQMEKDGILEYIHFRKVEFQGHAVYGYAFVPPTPFLLKDFERYDVSRYVDPGSVSPEEGIRTVPVAESEMRDATMENDLNRITGGEDLQKGVFLFHAPPHRSGLDRAALDGKCVEHAPLDVNVGSIAVRRFIESRKPFITLHGHVHESARLTGIWKEQIGRTWCFGAAHDGPELSLIRFDLMDPAAATRALF
jgi:uncharacterized protein